MESIKDMVEKEKSELLDFMEQKGFDTTYILEMEYRKTIYWLRELYFRTEKTLMDLQAEDMPNQKRIESVERTFNRITFIYSSFTKMDARVKELEEENAMLKEKFEYFKTQYKK